MSIDEYLKSLENFVTKHNLKGFIRLSSTVVSCQRCEHSAKWKVQIKKSDGETVLHLFDSLAICTGTNAIPYMPSISGQESFKGTIEHSKHFGDPKYKYSDKNVLIVGGGESASDIALEVAKVAKSVLIAVRNKFGHIVSRSIQYNKVSDMNTNRLRFTNPYIFGSLIGFITQVVRKIMSFFASSSNDKKVIQTIAKINFEQNTSAFSKFGCKSEGIAAAVSLFNARIHKGNFIVDNGIIAFDDGMKYDCDAIIMCTGYKNKFSFLEEFHPELSDEAICPRNLFLQMFSTKYPAKDIVFLGFARPAFGAIPPIVELQSRLYALILTDKVVLPSENILVQIAYEDKVNWQKRFPDDSSRLSTLVDFQIYCDSIASYIGCLPPLRELLFTDPYYFLKIMIGPLTVHQYRIVGPGKNPNIRNIIVKAPTGDITETIITGFFLLLSYLLSFLGWRKFRPNN
jgi:dimethylaniline monooxygenase (N-oxide forming)